jgi:hypothetical protein
MPPEQIVAVVRLHLDALDNEAGPTEPTASALSDRSGGASDERQG